LLDLFLIIMLIDKYYEWKSYGIFYGLFCILKIRPEQMCSIDIVLEKNESQ
jgi:hypothetical protein